MRNKVSGHSLEAHAKEKVPCAFFTATRAFHSSSSEPFGPVFVFYVYGLLVAAPGGALPRVTHPSHSVGRFDRRFGRSATSYPG